MLDDLSRPSAERRGTVSAISSPAGIQRKRVEVEQSNWEEGPVKGPGISAAAECNADGEPVLSDEEYMRERVRGMLDSDWTDAELQSVGVTRELAAELGISHPRFGIFTSSNTGTDAG
jgi:hypothetical protein